MNTHSTNVNKRLSWDEYFLLIVKAVSKRATCDRGKSGCIIVKDNRILATGYVGAPHNLPHCDEVGHLFHNSLNENGKITAHCGRTVHAEQNALAQAAKYGMSINKATLYCTMEPCFNCAKLIVASGIIKVVCNFMYHAAIDSRKLLKEANIELKVINPEILDY